MRLELELNMVQVRLVTVGISVRNLHAVCSTQRGKQASSWQVAVWHIGITVGGGGEIWPRIA